MNHEEARRIIEANPRRTLVVRFIRRTDGKLRRMVCMWFPTRADGLSFRFDPAAKKLLPVWDCEKGAVRFVSLDGVESIKQGGAELRPHGLTEEETARQREAEMRLAELDVEMAELFGTLRPL